uniref:multicopper oxidase domain-containing protein n=1 Tax=Indioceanicola profundi TaxID=2220096 RepID=UPI000E6AAC9B
MSSSDRGLSRRDALRLAGVAGLAGVFTIHPERRSFASADQTLDLLVQPTRITIDGRTSPAISMGSSIPAPTLFWREGQEVVIRVTNRLAEPTSMHWHGLLLEGVMDGAPGFNGYEAIPPGGTYTYRLKLRQAGTYWYHSHSAMQEQAGMYGAIVIEPAGRDPIWADRDYVVLLPASHMPVPASG